MDVLGDNEDDAVEEHNMPVDFPLINKDKVMALEESIKTDNTFKKLVCINVMIFFCCISLNDKIINVLKCWENTKIYNINANRKYAQK